MPIEKLSSGQVVCVFGTGDILIAPGIDEGTGDSVPTAIILVQQEAHPIDVPMPELKGTKVENWSVKLYFNKIESVNSFIHVLEDFRRDKWGSDSESIECVQNQTHNSAMVQCRSHMYPGPCQLDSLMLCRELPCRIERAAQHQ
jgi:hypothetical protein